VLDNKDAVGILHLQHAFFHFSPHCVINIGSLKIKKKNFPPQGEAEEIG